MSDDVIYRVMTEDDINSVKTLLYTSFFNEEPLSRSVMMENPRESSALVEPLTELAAKGQVSIVAICKNSVDIIGCRLSVINKQSEPFYLPTAPDSHTHTNRAIVLKYFKNLRKGIDIFQLYGVDICVYSKAICVRKDYGGRGIGLQMMKESVALGKSKGIRLFVSEATGLFSQKIYETLGFDMLNEVSYKDYVNENGEKVLGDTGIHLSGKLFAKLYTDD